MSEQPNRRDELDAIIVAQWFRLKPERQRDGRSLTIALDITRKWPRAFAAICAKDLDAASIAVRRGWAIINARASWEGITEPEVRAKIRDIQQSLADGRANPFTAMLGSFLATALDMHAPHHLPLLPPAWLAASQANQR